MRHHDGAPTRVSQRMQGNGPTITAPNRGTA